jgi:hypothetical protein
MNDSNNNPISNMTIHIGDTEGMSIYFEGKHKLELVHNITTSKPRNAI